MSVTWLSRAWDFQCGSPTKKAVLIALADRCGEEGICWPSYRDLMTRTEFGRTTVVDALSDLEVDGVIESRPRARSNGSDTSKEYQLLIPAISGGYGSRTGGVREPDGGGTAAGPPEPSRNRQRRTRERGPSSGTARGRRPRAEPEDHGDDDAPALGGDPRQRDRGVRKALAAERGQSGFGLALRLQKKLAHLEGSAATVDVGLLAKRLNALHRAGTHSWELLQACVDVYAGAPDRYRSGDLKGWTQFLAAMPKLEKDADNHRRATTPAHVGYVDPYAGAE